MIEHPPQVLSIWREPRNIPLAPRKIGAEILGPEKPVYRSLSVEQSGCRRGDDRAYLGGGNA